jgi:hypothetical protein
MMKNLLMLVVLTTCTTFLYAQKKDEAKYKERAAEIQEEIWSSGGKPFEVTTVADEYKNESAVVIAKYLFVTNSSKYRYKFSLFGGRFATRLKYYTTLRERVKINDKTALDDYSTLEYKKNLNATSSIGFNKIVETYKTYVGAKIIKPDGTKETVNVEEEVLTKNENKDKEGKLAISNLQVGDILDYYVRIEEVTENGADTRGPNVFPLGGEYPIMYYNVKYTLDKKCGADVMSMNGAKAIPETEGDDDDIILEFTERNLPKLKYPMWSSFARQIPYHVIRYGFSGSSIMASPGQIKRGPFTDAYRNKLKEYYKATIVYRQIDFSPEKDMADYFGGKKELKNQPADSIVNYLYNYFKWSQYGGFGNMDVGISRNDKRIEWYNVTVTISEILRDYDIDNDIGLICNRYSGRLNEVFGLGDFEPFLKINSDGKIKYLTFTDFFHYAGEIPASYQGENAIIFTREGKDRKPKYADTETPIKLPVTKSSQNVVDELLKVEFDKDNMLDIIIDRTINESGSMKQSDQSNLLLAQDVNDEIAALIKKPSTLSIYEDNKKLRAKGEELKVAFDNERKNQKDYMKSEIKGQFDQEPKELKSYKILNSGLALQNPVLSINQVFTMENFVKKVGNNYILNIGSLMGTYKKIDEKERKREVDVYMSSARTLKYTFNVTIPEGYNVKGVNELNKKIENDVASFVTTASVNGNVLTASVVRTFNNNFEPAANWDKLLQIIDASADFNEIKVLFEKKK